eukprot:5924097-Prymnesium_polylepis.1
MVGTTRRWHRGVSGAHDRTALPAHGRSAPATGARMALRCPRTRLIDDGTAGLPPHPPCAHPPCASRPRRPQRSIWPARAPPLAATWRRRR